MTSRSPGQWWADAVGYQIYIRSFADSDDDGVGDLGGIRSKLGYLSDLGVDFIWITPFYPSPGDDWGYDVADYCDIDPLFGDLAAFDDLLAGAHARGIRVVADLVPNHSSSAHRWFQAALGNAGDAARVQYRDYFVWRDPAPDGGPPNNWVGYFGGLAWTLDPASVGVQRQAQLRESADREGFAEEGLWTGIGRARSGAGAAIVGDPDQVAAKLGAYSDVGIDAFILSGYPHIAECDRFGRLVLETMPHRKLWQP